MPVDASLIQHLRQATGRDLQNHRLTRIGGGDINTAFRLQAAGVDWFIKLNHACLLNMFTAEAAGLQELASLQQVKVPNVVLFGAHDNHAYLLLEYETLGALRGDSASRFGSQLARLHRQPQAYFGWHIPNTIGSTPQHNERSEDWVAFWQHQRLGKQLQFAADNGFAGKLQINGEKLIDTLPALFNNYRPHPSLLHGDLWGGNAAADLQGNPVMFDPACYYGDRETDIAMTELFGGFGSNFYSAYNAEYPLDPDYKTRKTLYNLYHILNHLNLFGGGYLGQANGMIERLLSEIQ